MNTIKMTYSFNIILIKLFSLLTLTVCQNQGIDPSEKNITNNSITKISFSSSGGRSAQYENLDISSSSLIYTQGRNGSTKSIREKTARNFWTSMSKAINIKDFDQVKSNPGHALYDGIDITITIERGKEKHTVVNGSDDSVNYTRIKAFTDLLENKLLKLREKITW